MKELFKKALEDGLAILRYQEERLEQEEIPSAYGNYEQFPFLNWSVAGLPEFSYSSVSKKKFSSIFLHGSRYAEIASWKTLQAALLKHKDYVQYYSISAEEEVAKNYHTYFFLAEFLDHYVHTYGSPQFHEKTFEAIFSSFYSCFTSKALKIDIWVPILFLHFPVGNVDIEPGLSLRQIDDPRQLGRAYFGRHLHSKLQQVFASATHAFVFEGWTLENTSFAGRNDILNDPNAFSDIISRLDYLVGALHIVTGEETGYGQLLAFPSGWADHWTADLPLCYPVEHHHFPASFLNQKWKHVPPKIKEKDVQEMAQIYQALAKGGRKSLEVGVSRLNSIYLKDQAPESVIDLLTGLEALLLSETQGDPVYRLGMRLGSLLQRAPFSRKEAADPFKLVHAFYQYKLNILKGTTHLNGKERKIDFYEKKTIDLISFGTELLRHILFTFFREPELQDPAFLDLQLLKSIKGK